MTPDYRPEYGNWNYTVRFFKMFHERKPRVKFSLVGSRSIPDQTDCGLVGGGWGLRGKQVALGLEGRRLGDPPVILVINNIMRQPSFICIRSILGPILIIPQNVLFSSSFIFWTNSIFRFLSFNESNILIYIWRISYDQ